MVKTIQKHLTRRITRGLRPLGCQPLRGCHPCALRYVPSEKGSNVIDSADIKEAHKHSIRHRGELRDSSVCGCFYCLDVFDYKNIEDWIDGGDTALCPSCGIDSVIGSASGYPVSPEFLAMMKEHWF